MEKYINQIKELEKEVCSSKRYRQITIDYVQNFVADYEYDNGFENNIDERLFIGSNLRHMDNILEVINKDCYSLDSEVFEKIKIIFTNWMLDVKEVSDVIN